MISTMSATVHYPLTTSYLSYLESFQADDNTESSPRGSLVSESSESLDERSEKIEVPSVIFFRTRTSTTTMPNTTNNQAGGRRAGAGNYSKDEVMYLLSVLEEVLPIGPDEWETVVTKHAIGYPGRDVDSIRRKFESLHRKQIPTGDPNMPEEVRLAKRVKYMIGDKANIGDGEEDYQLEQAEFVGYESEQINQGVLHRNLGLYVN